MKINLKKKLEPYTVDDKYLKAQSKLLKSIVFPEDGDDIQEGEEPRNYPDYDDKDKFLDEFQRGEH